MKRLLQLFIILIILFSIPSIALADASVSSPLENYPCKNFILIDDYTKVISVELWGHTVDDTYEQIKIGEEHWETKVPGEYIIYFYNSYERFKDFQLIVTLKTGEKKSSDFMSIGFIGQSYFKLHIADQVDFGSYIYSVKDNTLKAGNITTAKPDGYQIFFASLILLLPLALTVLIKWLVSFAFNLKPRKHIVTISLVTNAVIFILLILIYIYIFYDLLLTLIILEGLVAIAECWLYARRYKGYTIKRLLLFTVTTCLASWLLYWFLCPI